MLWAVMLVLRMYPTSPAPCSATQLLLPQAAGCKLYLDEGFGGVHLNAHAQHLGGLLADQQVVTGDHLDLNTLQAATRCT